MTSTEAINTLYYDDMDILHIDIGGSSPPRKETEMIHPKDSNNTTLTTYYASIVENGPYPSLKQLG